MGCLASGILEAVTLKYDPAKLTVDDILALEVFQYFRAVVRP
jgi:peptide methionine sulfoxide reductase MsrA